MNPGYTSASRTQAVTRKPVIPLSRKAPERSASPSAATAVAAWAAEGTVPGLPGYRPAAEAVELTLYRADGRNPRLIREKGGMLAKDRMPLTEVKQRLVTDPRAFEQAHVSTNLPYLVSTAKDMEAGGYATRDRFLYRIRISGLYRFEQSPPARSNIMRKPVIYANAPSFDEATVILMETSKDTGEVDFCSGIPAGLIVGYQAPGAEGFSPFVG